MPSTKRKRSTGPKSQFTIGEGDINDNFLVECETAFQKDPRNVIARNAVNSVGSMLSTIDSTRINEICHVFLNSVKRKNVRATNQGASGRCWIFAALNMFRHVIMHVLNLENFEFSEVYLFFWDKFERANTYLRWFIEHPEASPGDRDFDYMITEYNSSDGGWWNMLAALVQKYGLVPLNAMRETFQSDDSGDMNQIIKEQLDGCVNYILANRDSLSLKEQHKLRRQTLKEIYATLVKFLGVPPKTFTWSFTTDDDESAVISEVNPRAFFEMVAPGIDLVKDFVVLAHIPGLMDVNTSYTLRYTRNIHDGPDYTYFNTTMEEITKYTLKSISSGLAVWVVADVSQSFNWFAQTLDDKLDAHTTVFQEKFPFEKGDRIAMRNVQGRHAMCLTGFNLGADGIPVSWQCENSWGYADNETPGLDGFLFMSHSWFQKYVIMVSVKKAFLSRTFRKQIEREPEVLNPWDGMAPAKTDGRGVPGKYAKILAELKAKQK